MIWRSETNGQIKKKYEISAKCKGFNYGSRCFDKTKENTFA